MRKVTTINLNNNAFQVDEEGYEALRRYLENAAHALTSNPDRDEILADLEQAIADKCQLALGPHKSVVSEADIQQILAEMGPVTDGSANADNTETSGGGAAAASTGTEQASATRRLYRLPDNAFWSGVCAGLAAYFGIDVVWVRLAFVFATIFGGWGLLIYIVMIFVVPKALTSEERAAAHGQPFSAQELVDRLKKNQADFRSYRRERRRGRPMGWWSPAATQQPPPGYAARVAGGLMLPLLTILSAAWFSAMAIAAFAVWHHGSLAVGPFWSPHNWGLHEDFPRWVALVVVIAVYGLLAIPIAAGRRAALYYANGGRSHGWADAWSGLLWIALVAVLLLTAWHALPELHDLVRLHINHRGVITL